MRDDELDSDVPSEILAAHASACATRSLQQWLREAFPVHARPGVDYRALRAENARRHARATLIRGRETSC